MTAYTLRLLFSPFANPSRSAAGVRGMLDLPQGKERWGASTCAVLFTLSTLPPLYVLTFSSKT